MAAAVVTIMGTWDLQAAGAVGGVCTLLNVLLYSVVQTITAFIHQSFVTHYLPAPFVNPMLLCSSSGSNRCCCFSSECFSIAEIKKRY